MDGSLTPVRKNIDPIQRVFYKYFSNTNWIQQPLILPILITDTDIKAEEQVRILVD